MTLPPIDANQIAGMIVIFVMFSIMGYAVHRIGRTDFSKEQL